MTIKSSNKTELALAYNVSLGTFNKWLSKIEGLNQDKSTRIFTPKQVALIVKHLGEPDD